MTNASSAERFLMCCIGWLSVGNEMLPHSTLRRRHGWMLRKEVFVPMFEGDVPAVPCYRSYAAVEVRGALDQGYYHIKIN